MAFFSLVPLRAPRRAGVRGAGRLWGSGLSLGFWLPGCLLASRWRPFLMCRPLRSLFVDEEFFFSSSGLLHWLLVLGRGLYVWNLLAKGKACFGSLPFLCRPRVTLGCPSVLRQLPFGERSGDLWKLKCLSPLFLGRIRGRLWCPVLGGGTDKREFHLPDFLLLDLPRTVALMGAPSLWLLGTTGTDERQFTGVSFLSWRGPGRGSQGLI